MLGEKSSLTPEKAVEILREHGTIVTIEEAKLILDFMYKFATLAVNQIVGQTKQEEHGKEKHQSANYLPRQKNT